MGKEEEESAEGKARGRKNVEVRELRKSEKKVNTIHAHPVALPVITLGLETCNFFYIHLTRAGR